ncbi:hypothetical protein HRI_000726400 [Hibiscus trionum]|uniref:Reverse transcriptase domain-containing protein n=1 Tax=Hibiscus trionum TaxID=183268 RepID=A0A9W7H5S0_HIBTR|nr:hypothetical protein HRI_000726400 [Hibiscus trionum]
MVIKIDLEKAYDRLEWAFINDTFRDVGISDNLCLLIMSCVSSVTSQIAWNESMTESFRPSRGIQQGDPLLSYLFVLCMERLSQVIDIEVRSRKWIPFIFGRRVLEVSHLFFADGHVVICKGVNGSNVGL